MKSADVIASIKENPQTVAMIATGIVAAGVAIYVATRPKSARSRNPFLLDSRQPAKDFEFDRAKRDVILKNGYSETKLAATGENFDAIVIGSGIGGLTTAAILARAGKKVLVLEQHDQCGGCCHSFYEKGFEFDTGIHYIGECRNNTAFRFLLDQLSSGHLGWTNVRDDFDTVVLVEEGANPAQDFSNIEQAISSGTPLKSRQVSFMSGEKETIDSLIRAFPDEEKGIRKYFHLLGELRKATQGFVGLKFMPKWLGSFLVSTGLVHLLGSWFKYAQLSTRDVIRSVTSNRSLQAVLAYNFGDYGTIPKDSPFAMHAILQNHFLKGVSYPVGGSSEIAYHIVPTITAAGGAVFVRAEVGEVVLDSSNRAVVGVRMKRDGRVINAPVVVSAAGVYNTVKLLPEAGKAQLSPSLLSHVRHGLGGISVYVGLKGSNAELQLQGKHFWALWTKEGQEDLDGMVERYLQRPRSAATSAPIPLLFISFPSAKDPLWDQRHPGKATCTIVTVGNFDWFAEHEHKRVMHRGPEYEAFKQALGQLIWRQTLALFPHLRDHVEYFEIGSPVTNNYYLASSAGEMYGADHDLRRFSAEATVALRPDTAIKGLFLSGQDVFTCGFAGATFGGLISASAVLNRNVYADLVKLKARAPPSIKGVK